MRTPQKLTSDRTGETYYRVRYRRRGQQKALTFWGDQALREAREFAGMVDALGADKAVAWWNANLEARDAITLDEWWPRYLAALTKATDGTRITYQRIYDRVWREPLGSLPLDAIGREAVALVVNQLSAERSDKTVRNAYGVLAGALNRAAADNIIPANPVRGLDLPERTSHLATEMRFLTHAEWGDLYDALPEHYRPLFTTLVGTGIRWGEAEALLVSDVVLTPTPVVRISKAAKWNASKATREIGPTKTRRSRRTVTLPPEVVAELTPLLGRKGSERLFLAMKGGPLRHRTVYDEWKAAVEHADLEPQPRIHDLRHTQVAWLVAAGVPLPVIQARLGHEHISTTIDRYGHLLPDLQAAAAEAASLAMRGATRAIG